MSWLLVTLVGSAVAYLLGLMMGRRQMAETAARLIDELGDEIVAILESGEQDGPTLSRALVEGQREAARRGWQ